MSLNARYTHTNLVARDWKGLSDFYSQVLDCESVPPERDLFGQWLDDATAIPDVHICGIHLRLPGWGEDGPTLEIFQYDPAVVGQTPAANRPGYGHLAFVVDDVRVALDAVLAAGGSAIGELVSVSIPGRGMLDFVYACDPEGNIVELQNWRG
jgi:catechol 2,3-dioxygenase-like lactoylglutathione lyase family enzyme